MKSLPAPLYTSHLGAAYLGDAQVLLQGIPDSTIDLVLTSPPFALQRQKEYGNPDQDEYVEWMLTFAREVRRVLKPTGSFVIDLGGAYQKGRPVRSLYNYRMLIRMCDEIGWNLAEEFFWYNPSKLPSPIEWVNKRKIRVKDAVNTIWWLSKTDFPKANVNNVLTPYSDRMKKLLKNAEDYYTPKKRPSGHNISIRFAEDKGGAIPSNLLQIPNTESNSHYLRCCQLVNISGHPARFPEKIPDFFIRFLTETGDVVLDIFAGSNTTGAVAERLGRRWIAFEIEQTYLAASAFRFLQQIDETTIRTTYELLMQQGACQIRLPQTAYQPILFEMPVYYDQPNAAD